MPYPIERKLVVGVSSNALFNLETEDNIFVNEGIEEYRNYQIANKTKPLKSGIAMPFIKRFLNINNIYPDEAPVEVVLLSKNSPETGIRIFNAIKDHNLDITRAAFTSGKSPYKYIPAYNISLFLSTNEADVKNAINSNHGAGRILKTNINDDNDDMELRVAFDFDGVIADDQAEKIFKETGQLDLFHEHEQTHIEETHNPGPLADFFKKLSFFQQLETKKEIEDSNYKKIVKTAIVTARNAPSHERAIKTLQDWGVTVDEMFLLGGIDKARILDIIKPHLFFDDQISHLDPKLENIPLVHIPFGIANIK
ncbi:5'-nucleotidase [Elizabethkingia anophelis]|uniref:5'-nucleotidase n=1 Tax=Elizabethkingia anophelis TaxID=1117645 RepID=UPI0021A905C4|nr:5'-nucleotidase [Elizabethkingia anophelis]MCT3922237.1 5'-nucleotidase [Elizabethkingia anophelis]MCT3957673.1 5'-nucleotidase [Elizabethkingia anophelis]MCT4061174.1 5'-nucleotidase [Elizabethkingia anophelis]MCT4107466.1 5'-nucleotidase [Elizabethkingia anophelis]MCT4137555.1 5'-nucleotidase [Elizabethkingia anophelis]